MATTRDNGVSTPRLGIEDTLHALLDNVQQMLSLLGLEIGDHGSDRVSSITVENMAKGPPKITTHLYAGSLFGREDVDLALDVHAYACRESERRQKAEWKETADLAAAGVPLAEMPSYGHGRLINPPSTLQAMNGAEEELPDFESVATG